MSLPTGAIVKNPEGIFFIIEGNSKKQFPDVGTLSALTAGQGTAIAQNATDAILNAIPSGTPFPSVAAFVTANPRIATTVKNVLLSMTTKSGLKNLPGGWAAIVESALAMFNDAEKNPSSWGNTINHASKANPITEAENKVISTAINSLINTALKQLGGDGIKQNQSDAVDSTIDADTAAYSDDNEDPSKDPSEKESIKEAGEKETGEKEAGDKEEDKDNKDDPDHQKDEKDNKDDPDNQHKEEKDNKDNKDDPDNQHKEEKDNKDNKDDPDKSDEDNSGDGGGGDGELTVPIRNAAGLDLSGQSLHAMRKQEWNGFAG